MIWNGRSANRDAETAARNVSLLYLDELAGRREQVVEDNLQENIEKIQVAVGMMTGEDLEDEDHLHAYQRRMKELLELEKFAFVDTNGLIYTSQGTQTNIEEYRFDHTMLEEPEVSVLNLQTGDKKVIIAVPVDLRFLGKRLTVCFMEIDMQVMLEGFSMQETDSRTTFCNLYTRDGIALSDMILGGLAVEDNLLEAMEHAQVEEGYSLEQMTEEFRTGQRGVVSFVYNGVRETLSYAPVRGTDWQLTYLIKESVVNDQIASVSGGILTRSLILSLLTAMVLAGMFGFIILQNRRNAKLALEKETSEAENRVKQQEMEQRIALQEELLKRKGELSEALEAAEQASRAKTAFLSNMSHEIRTPMNAIIGLNNMALNEPELPGKVREYLEKTGDSAKHLLGIINDILDMSRIESGRMVIKNEEFDFSRDLEQVNTMISGQCADKGLQYECRKIGRIDDRYVGDGMKLKQVMINILGNAVKFTPAGGKVTFLIEEGKRYAGKATLKMTFRDTGIGMSKEYLPRLFDAFSQEDASTTNRYGSTGLGMPITKSIVELMNGHIEVESEKGTGTTFRVTVTLGESDRKNVDTADGGPETREAEKTAPNLKGKRILLAEDVAVNAEIMVMTLGMKEIETDVAENGRIAVEKFTDHPAGYYDAILMDMRMPEMDGLEATRTIRGLDREDAAGIPIIALTANAFDEDVQRSLQAGLNAHLSKPVEPDILFETLEKLIRTS